MGDMEFAKAHNFCGCAVAAAHLHIKMGDMEFAKAHNSAIFLEDPPAVHNDLKFIVDGLKKSCLVHALTTSPAIYQSLIKEFWRNAVLKKNGQGGNSLKQQSKTRKFNIRAYGIRGNFSSYNSWMYLAHVFVSCISGRRSGANEISLANIGAITALAAEDVRKELEEQSMPMKNEDISHSPSKPVVEEIHDSPTAYVADEHDNQKANDSKYSREDDDDDLYEDVEFLKEINFIGINDDIPTNIEFDLGDEDFDPFLDIPSIHVNKVNEFASLATKTRDERNVFKIVFSTSKPLEIAPSQGDVTSEIPPSVLLISISAPISSDSTEPQTSIKTSQPLVSLKVPGVRCAPQVLSTITTTSAHSPPKQTDEGPSTIFETGGSSSIPEYSPTRPSLDEASIRLVKHMALSSISSSRGKGISFKEGRTCDDKSSSPDLREEIGILHQELIEKSIQMDQLSAYIFELRAKDEEKTKQINDLQTSLRSVLANYFNLKNIFYDAFGEKVKALFQQPHGVVDPPSVQSPPTIDDPPINPPVPRTTKIVNRFEKEPEGSRAKITIKQGNRIVTANQQEESQLTLL
ncbi:unnamed protein product [Lactuca saligna]|uniref:Uncharacterized protein n=1 Tax=Lactuca saligna TaxID=75948 RepID=A0AA35VXE4_LACSI|nr:unnamed protein product [Lactuca saligna]